jgi:hypothetical protein
MSVDMYGVPGRIYVPSSGTHYHADDTTGKITAAADIDVSDLSRDGCVGSSVVNAAASLGAVTSVGGRTGAVVLLDGVLGSGTPAAATVTGLTNSGYIKGSVGNALTAVGTNRATALQLAAEFNNVTVAASGTGVLLPVGVVGMSVYVFADSGIAGAAIQVYATASETIDTVAGSTGKVLTKGNRCMYKFVAANTWISAQLGVISA